MTALGLLGGLILDDGRRWAEAATDWQKADAAAVLEPGPGDPRLHWLGRPKGGSKSTDLAGIGLAWLVDQAQPGWDAYALAADLEQSQRLLDKARGFVARTPGLESVVDVQANRIVNRTTGARIIALAADVAGSEGLLTPLILVDELPNWLSTSSARGMWTSVFSALPKWRGARLAVIGHAGDPAHWSHRILEQARASGAWRVHEVPGPLPWVSAEDLELQRSMLSESQFRRRHLNVWTGSEDRLASVDDLRACVTLSGPQVYRPDLPYVAALDVGLTNDRTVAVVCHAAPVRRFEGLGFDESHTATGIVLDRIRVWQGSRAGAVRLADVEDWLAASSELYGWCPVVVDPYQAIGTAQRLRDRMMNVEVFNFGQQSVGRLASTLHLLIRNRALALPDDEALLDELANVRLRETSPGVVRMDHDAGSHDDRAIALALASLWLIENGQRSFDWGSAIAGQRPKLQELLDRHPGSDLESVMSWDLNRRSF